MTKRGWLTAAVGLGAVGVGVLAVAVLGGGEPEDDYYSVITRDDFFAPQIVRVDVGEEVEWENTGRSPTPSPPTTAPTTAGSSAWDEFSHTYDTPGLYPFFCTLHGSGDGVGMAAMVVVGGVALSDGSGSGVGPGEEPVPGLGPDHVPDEEPTIQSAVDAASPGDLILVAPGVYEERLVLTPYLTIQGEDRNTTILDGAFREQNGIHVAEADGVVLENLTARHYQLNGFY